MLVVVVATPEMETECALGSSLATQMYGSRFVGWYVASRLAFAIKSFYCGATQRVQSEMGRRTDGGSMCVVRLGPLTFDPPGVSRAKP